MFWILTLTGNVLMQGNGVHTTYKLLQNIEVAWVLHMLYILQCKWHNFRNGGLERMYHYIILLSKNKWDCNSFMVTSEVGLQDNTSNSDLFPTLFLQCNWIFPIRQCKLRITSFVIATLVLLHYTKGSCKGACTNTLCLNLP